MRSCFFPSYPLRQAHTKKLDKVELRREEIAAGCGPATTLADFLDKIQSGEFSYVWSVPKDVQDSSNAELRRWCGSRFDLHLPVPMPAKLQWVVYEKPGWTHTTPA